jgi:hypothetical protein
MGELVDLSAEREKRRPKKEWMPTPATQVTLPNGAAMSFSFHGGSLWLSPSPSAQR